MGMGWSGKGNSSNKGGERSFTAPRTNGSDAQGADGAKWGAMGTFLDIPGPKLTFKLIETKGRKQSGPAW